MIQIISKELVSRVLDIMNRTAIAINSIIEILIFFNCKGTLIIRRENNPIIK